MIQKVIPARFRTLAGSSLLLLVCVWNPSHADVDFAQLMHEGNLLRLQGDMSQANKIRDAIRSQAPDDPASYSFNLNTIVTELSWEESQTRFDEALLQDSERLLALCEAGATSAASINNPDYYCGQAHFTLSYYHGIQGNLITAGRHGTTAIDYMEDALKQDPDLIRAKMFLGIMYFYADNLPPFIKLFSRLLWFIPSGNSDKSLPYLFEVMASDDQFSDVARYIYATLLINGTAEELREALTELEILLMKYPANVRFQLRYVSIIQGDGRYQETLDSIDRFRASDSAKTMNMIDSNLLNIWLARANLGLNNIEEAARVQKTIHFDPENTTVPAWGLAWFELTNGQLADIRGDHETARRAYETILELDRTTFVNPDLVNAANRYIRSPYEHAAAD